METTGILDQVIANTASGPRIISENNDVNSINWVAGLTDPGELIACGYLPQIRRLNGEQDDAYLARITPIVATLPLEQQNKIKAAAIKRFGVNVTNGKISLLVAGEAPWSRLGTHVEEAVSGQHVLRLSGTDWQAAVQPLTYIDPNTGEIREQKNVFGVIRQDTGAFLGSVGNRYKVIQNAEVVEFLDAALGEFGAKYEMAGALLDGQKVWFQCRLPASRFTVGSKDEIEPYAIFTNCHDGTEAARCFPTANRVVCQNTFRIAKRDGKGKGIYIRHTGDLKAKIESAKQALGLAVEGFKEFAEQSNVLATVKLPDHDRYFNGILDQVLEITEAEALKGADALTAALKLTEAEAALKRKSIQRQIDKRADLFEDILTRYESERCGTNGSRGTVYSAWNAITESCDHGKLGGRYQGSQSDRDSRRFESVLTGSADDTKQLAYELALNYAQRA